MRRELQETRQSLSEMQEERQHYEEKMKQAFMRGVCALNMEAMGVFQSRDNQSLLEPHEAASEPTSRGPGENNSHSREYQANSPQEEKPRAPLHIEPLLQQEPRLVGDMKWSSIIQLQCYSFLFSAATSLESISHKTMFSALGKVRCASK